MRPFEIFGLWMNRSGYSRGGTARTRAKWTRPARVTTRTCFAIAVCSGIAGCDGPTHGTIYGDVYLAEDLTSITDVKGLTVRLIVEPDRDTANLDTTLAAICTQRDRYIATTLGEPPDTRRMSVDSLGELGRDANERGWRARTRMLSAFVSGETRTDDRAAYRIDSVAPGSYRLWADTLIGTRRWSWLRPINIEAGDSVKLDLTNANSDENPFRCVPPARRDPWEDRM